MSRTSLNAAHSETDFLLGKSYSSTSTSFETSDRGSSHGQSWSSEGRKDMQTSRGNKWALAGLLVLSGAFISVSLVQNLTSLVSTIANAFNSATMIVGILVVILLHVTDKKLAMIKSYLYKKSGFKYLIQSQITLIPIVLLFWVGLILDYFTIIAGVSCSDVWYQCGETVKGIYISGLVLSSLRIIFMGLMTLFCRNFYNMRFDNSRCGVRFGLVVLASVTVSQWFESLSLEIFDRNGKHADNLTDLCIYPINDSRANACLNQQTKDYQSLKNVRTYIFPIKIEYYLLVCEFLLATFLNHESKNGGSLDTTIDLYNNNEICEEGVKYFDGENWEKKESVLKTYFHRLLTTFLFPASSVLFCAFAFFDSKLLNDREQPQQREMFYVYSILYYSVMTISVLVCFAISRQFRKRHMAVTGFEWLVMFSASGIIMDNILRINAVAELLKCDYWSPTNNTCGYRVNSKPHLAVDPGMYITTDAIDSVQVIVQIPFIAYCQRVFLPSRPRLQQYRKIYQTLLMFIIMSNFANWLANSVLFSGNSPAYVYYGNFVSVWVVSLISPFEVFFRISSTILFLQAFWKEDGKDSDDNPGIILANYPSLT